MKIHLYIKQVYGVEKLYPVSNDKQWEALTGKKTFTYDTCQALINLGFEVIINDPRNGQPLSPQTFFSRGMQ